MPIQLYRIDDRLIHGQVVVGWGQPLNIQFVVLVDDTVCTCDWECDLYRMGVPPEMEIHFETVESAIAAHAKYAADPRPGMLVVGDITTMRRLIAGIPEIRAINIGGIHSRPGRGEKLKYVFLTKEEEAELRDINTQGIEVTAQDLPNSVPTSLDEILSGGNQPAHKKSA
jgi:mannose/fructose/N-acetylgalactosamine-specific phosphotransferase system component IIB